MLMYHLLQCHDLLNFYCFYVHAFSFVTTFRILFIPCISYLVLSKYISIRTYFFFSGELFCKCKKKQDSVISVPIKPCVPVDYRLPVKPFAHSCTSWKCFKNVSARHLHKCRPHNFSHLTFVYHLKLSWVGSQGWHHFNFLVFFGALDSSKKN